MSPNRNTFRFSIDGDLDAPPTSATLAQLENNFECVIDIARDTSEAAQEDSFLDGIRQEAELVADTSSFTEEHIKRNV